MTLSNSDQNSKLPIKKSCELSIFQFFKKFIKKQIQLVAELKYYFWDYIAGHKITFLIIHLYDNGKRLLF